MRRNAPTTARERQGQASASWRPGLGSSRYWYLLAVVAAGLTAAATLRYGSLVPAGLFVVLSVLAMTAMVFRYPHRGLWLLAVALPFERLGTLDLGFFTLKAGHLVSALTLASLATQSILSRSWRFVRDPLRAPLLLLLAANVASLIHAVDLTRGLTLIVQLMIVLLVYFLTVTLVDRQNLRGVLLALWIGAGAVGLFGLYQFVGDYAGLPTSLTGLLDTYSGTVNFGFARIQGPSLEPLYFADYLLVPLLTAAAFFFGTKGRHRLPLALLLVLLAIVFVLTLARGAYLGFIGGAAFLTWQYRREIFTARVITGLAAVLSLIAIAVVYLLLQNTTRGGDPLAAFAKQIGVSGRDVSSQQRLGSIDAAKQLVNDRPLTGVGVGNFGEYYQDPMTGLNTVQKRQVVNNQTLETLVETGLFGLLSLILMAIVLFERTRYALKKVGGDAAARAALVGAAAAVVAIAIQAQSFSALYLLHVWFAIGLLVAVQNIVLLQAQGQSLGVTSSRGPGRKGEGKA